MVSKFYLNLLKEIKSIMLLMREKLIRI